MNISVLGCGRWGALLAWYSAKLGHNTILWGRENSENFKNLKNNRKNDYLELHPGIELSSKLEYALEKSDIVIISISSQNLRSFAQAIGQTGKTDKIFILAMKGLEQESGKRLSQVFKESIDKNVKVAAWLGPGHAQDFVKNIPNCMVITSEDIETTKQIVDSLGSDLIRFYYGQDMIGNEIGAAAKNVIGIAAGMLDGLGLSSLKGALMARGTREVSRLIRTMGGNEITAYGLCHLGDYEATLFSEYSNNRAYGENFVKGIKSEKLAEGVSTIKAMMYLSKKYGVELPISNALNAIIFDGKDAQKELEGLFLRSVKFEF